MTPPSDGFVRPSASHTTQHILLAVVGSLAIYTVCGLCVMAWDALFDHTNRAKLEPAVESLPSPAGANPKPSSPDKGASPAASPRAKTAGVPFTRVLHACEVRTGGGRRERQGSEGFSGRSVRKRQAPRLGDLVIDIPPATHLALRGTGSCE